MVSRAHPPELLDELAARWTARRDEHARLGSLVRAETLIRAPERALQLLAAATTALALALVLMHV